MQPWSNRVTEEAYLFNPAFCATLLAKTTEDYTKKAGRPFPLALVFLILPIVLHQGTRRALPSSTVTSLLPWIQDNREQLVDFANRVSRLSAITREAVVFGAQHQTLALADAGDLTVGAAVLALARSTSNCKRPSTPQENEKSNASAGPLRPVTR